MIKDSPNPPSDSNLLFTLRPGLDTETLLVNASQDLEGVQLLVDRVVDVTVAVS